MFDALSSAMGQANSFLIVNLAWILGQCGVSRFTIHTESRYDISLKVLKENKALFDTIAHTVLYMIQPRLLLLLHVIGSHRSVSTLKCYAIF